MNEHKYQFSQTVNSDGSYVLELTIWYRDTKYYCIHTYNESQYRQLLLGIDKYKLTELFKNLFMKIINDLTCSKPDVQFMKQELVNYCNKLFT